MGSQPLPQDPACWSFQSVMCFLVCTLLSSPPTPCSRGARCCAAIYYSCSNPLPALPDTWSGCRVLLPTEGHPRPLDLYLLSTSLLVLDLGLHVFCQHDWDITAFIYVDRLGHSIMSKIMKKIKSSSEMIWLYKYHVTFSRKVSPESYTPMNYLYKTMYVTLCCISHSFVLDTLT